MDGKLLKDYGMSFIESFKNLVQIIYSFELIITHVDFSCEG